MVNIKNHHERLEVDTDKGSFISTDLTGTKSGLDVSEVMHRAADIANAQLNLAGLKLPINGYDKRIAELNHNATHDTLTGLLNKRSFIELADERMKQFPNSPCAMIELDLNDFKEVNDTYGHEAGDEIIKIIANILHKSTRTEEGKDILARGERSDRSAARLGGDEFAIFISSLAPRRDHENQQLTDDERLRAIVERLYGEIANQQSTQKSGLPSISASIGGVLRTGGETAMDMLARADQAMYEQKRTHHAQTTPNTR